MERLFSESTADVGWLRPGVARALEAQVIPRLLGRHRQEPLLSAGPVGGHWLASLALADDEGALPAALERLQRQGQPVEALQLDWLGPAAVELGRRWEQDECTFADVTIGMVRLQCAARRLARGSVVPAWPDLSALAPRVLLALAPGEQHGFGLSLVADAFRRAGWDVTQAPAGLDPVHVVAVQAFDLVGLSLGSTARAAGMPELCAALRRSACRRGMGILLGGPLFAVPGLPVVPAPWGADAVALDARSAVSLAGAWMALRGTTMHQGAPPSGGRTAHLEPRNGS